MTSISAPVCTTAFTAASFFAMILGAILRFMMVRVAAIMSRVESFSSKPIASAKRPAEAPNMLARKRLMPRSPPALRFSNKKGWRGLGAGRHESNGGKLFVEVNRSLNTFEKTPRLDQSDPLAQILPRDR